MGEKRRAAKLATAADPRAHVADVKLTVKVLKVDGIWKKQQEHKNVKT